MKVKNKVLVILFMLLSLFLSFSYLHFSDNIKSLDNPVISQLIGEASRELRLARKCVFIGYSLSDADIHIKAFIRKQLKKDTELVVVNIKSAESLIPQYYALSNKVRFIQRSFEDMLKDDKLMQELLRWTVGTYQLSSTCKSHLLHYRCRILLIITSG